MNANWTSTTIGDFCPFTYGKGLPADKRKPGDVPVVSSAGITGTHDESLVNKKGIVIGRKGTVGSLTYCDRPFWAIDTAFYIADEPKKRDLRYTYYLLKTLSLESMNSDSAVPGLNRENAHSIEITVPSLELQNKIASHLSVLDDKIEVNQRINATLEAMARALFQSWFIDFDPVRAKLDGNKPIGIDELTANLFPDTFQDSELGNIPKGWAIKPVGEVVDCVGGGTPSTADLKYWAGGTHHWTTPKDFSSLQSPILLNTDRKLTDAGIAKISSGLLPAGTLLLSSRAPVGYLAIASMPVAINQGFIALKCNEYASNYFMLNWCQSNMPEIESRATGTTFAEISKQNFRPIRVVLPSKNLMSALRFLKILNLVG